MNSGGGDAREVQSLTRFVPTAMFSSGCSVLSMERDAVAFNGDGATPTVPHHTAPPYNSDVPHPQPHLRLMASELSWGMEYSRGMVLYGFTEMRTSPV